MKVSQRQYERGALVRLLWFGSKELVSPAERARHEEREEQNREQDGPPVFSTLTIGMLHTDMKKLQLVEPGSLPDGAPLCALRKVRSGEGLMTGWWKRADDQGQDDDPALFAVAEEDLALEEDAGDVAGDGPEELDLEEEEQRALAEELRQEEADAIEKLKLKIQQKRLRQEELMRN